MLGLFVLFPNAFSLLNLKTVMKILFFRIEKKKEKERNFDLVSALNNSVKEINWQYDFEMKSN